MFGLENNSFLINLAVSLLIALITLLYFRQQLSSLDHKVNSMFSLMTSMTQELNNISHLNLTQNETNHEMVENEIMNDQRINISESESESESESDGESESDSDDENEESEIELSPNDEIKTLNMGSELDTYDDVNVNIKVIDMDDDEDSSYYSSSNDNDIKELVTDLMEQTITLSDETSENNSQLESIELPFESLDNDETLDVEPIVKSIDVPLDYSKMSVKALKDIVASKNLANNVNKMKKKELIDLLTV